MKKKQSFPAGVKFLHFRELNIDGTIAGKGGVTVAYTTDVKDDTPVVYFGVAHCHADDAYNKALGRIKAFGRLKQLAAHGGDLFDTNYLGCDKYYSVFTDSVKEAVEKVTAAIEEDTGYIRVRKET